MFLITSNPFLYKELFVLYCNRKTSCSFYKQQWYSINQDPISPALLILSALSSNQKFRYIEIEGLWEPNSRKSPGRWPNVVSVEQVSKAIHIIDLFSKACGLQLNMKNGWIQIKVKQITEIFLFFWWRKMESPSRCIYSADSLSDKIVKTINKLNFDYIWNGKP